MEARRWMLLALLVLGALASEASAQNYLGLSTLPDGYNWAALSAGPCVAPPYGTFSSVPPGVYDNPSCCEQVWGGYCQKKAMHYQQALAKGSPCCSGEPCATPQRAACGPCRSNGSGCTRLPAETCEAAPLPPVPTPTMAPAPEPAPELVNPPVSEAPAPLQPLPASP